MNRNRLGGMMSKKIKFGTDGWRAGIADAYTFDSVRRCTQGFADYLRGIDHDNKNVVVGYDMRFLSEFFAKTAAEVLAGNGFKVFITEGASPTPVISFSVTDKKAIGAINITASHNPPTDNGFKVRDNRGGAVDPKGLLEIEKNIPNNIAHVKYIELDKAENQGLVNFFDPSEKYIQQLTKFVNFQELKDAGFKILVDPMWGNGIGWFPRLLDGGATLVEEIHDHRNPIFPEMLRPEPIPPNIDVGLAEVLNKNSDVLIINDGDADRVGIGDEKG